MSLSFVDAAETVLWRFGGGRPMHYRDITKLALAERLVQTKGKTPEATLYARIIDENAAASRRGREPRFERYGKGFVGLTAWHAPAAPPSDLAAGSTSSSAAESAAPIEAMLRSAGWAVAEVHELPSAPVAARNFRVGGRVLDYALLADRRMLALVEAKTHPVSLELLEQQTVSLVWQVADHMRGEARSLPRFIYLVNGPETFFLSDGELEPRREVAGFHRPQTLLSWTEQSPFAVQIGQMPVLGDDRLRAHQGAAVAALEASLASGDRRALLELPAGAGALTIAIAETHRLLRHTTARRILFLVDRKVLAYQAKAAFLDFETPDGRFGDLHSVELADSATLGADANVLIMTVQKLHTLTPVSLGELEFELDAEERQRGDTARRPGLPVDSFDLIWCQEPRGLLASAAGRLLDRFDAPIVGFNSAPSRDATAYFDGNVVVKIDLQSLIDRGERSAAEWVRAGTRRDLATPAPFLLDFLQRYLHDRGAGLLVDPAVLNPVLPAAIIDVNAALRAVGLVASANLLDLAQGDYADARIDWVQANLLEARDEELELLGAPDLIVSFPPLGIRGEPTSLTAPDGRTIELIDDAGHALLLKASMRLAPGGEAIFLVGESFLSRGGPARARALLGALGLHVHAVVAVEQGIAGLSAPLNLIFIADVAYETTFVGKLSAQIDTDQLISNLRHRRRGAAPELGRLVQWEDFRGYLRLATEERVALSIAATGLETVALAEILADPVRALSAAEQRFEPRENAIYLSRFPTGPVHTRLEQLTGEHMNYYQLIFDPRHALAEYLAMMFDTQLGRALREDLAHGRSRARIAPAALDGLQLPLPDLAVQREVSRAHAQIGGLRLELDGLERELAADPRSVPRIAKALTEIGQRDPLTTLRETLPFPLASILWRYEADADVAAKVEHLHRFFEAGAMYLAAILLSAFLADEVLLEQERGYWQLDPRALRRSSFGTWTHLGGQLAASVRRLAGDRQAGERMRSAFAVDAERFITAVSSSGVWQLLDEAKQERNRSKAHGGILGKDEQEDIHVLLGNLLTRLGGLIGAAMSEVRLVRPGAARFRGGVGWYERAELVQGPNVIFQQTEISAFPQMEADELYLLPMGRRTARNAMRLVPLVRLRSASRSAESACYFYSRLTDEDEVEFVSHHFEAQSRITLPDPELLEVFARLRAREG
jgi:hypothetical protein